MSKAISVYLYMNRGEAIFRHVPKSENLGVRTPPLPPPLAHAWFLFFNFCQIFQAYAYSFWQIFQALRLFKALCLFFLPTFPGPTFISCPIPESRVTLKLCTNCSGFGWGWFSSDYCVSLNKDSKSESMRAEKNLSPCSTNKFGRFFQILWLSQNICMNFTNITFFL